MGILNLRLKLLLAWTCLACVLTFLLVLCRFFSLLVYWTSVLFVCGLAQVQRPGRAGRRPLRGNGATFGLAT